MKSVSTVANAAYNNVLNLAATVTGLGQSLDDTNRNVTNCIGSIDRLNTSFTNASNKIGQLDSSQYNLSQNYWTTNRSLATVSSSLTKTCLLYTSPSPRD